MAVQLHEFSASWNIPVDSQQFAVQLDEKDPLKTFRNKFFIPSREELSTLYKRDSPSTPENFSPLLPISSTCTSTSPSAPSLYFCGHSLGLQPKQTSDYINEELEMWRKKGVAGHFFAPQEKEYPLEVLRRPWMTTDEYVYKLMARVVGALPEEVAVLNSLTTNLHLLMVSFYRPTKDRNKILIEKRAFPSDLYAVESQIKFHGYSPETSLIEIEQHSEGISPINTETILKRIEDEGDSIALVMLSGVQYLTGQFFDIPAITAAAHRKGCMVGFDLAHAVGNVPLELHDWNVDFACWCTYKYLNAGAGGIGGIFVHDLYAKADFPRFAGWWGHDAHTRFGMTSSFSPIPGAFGFRLSNPPVVCTASLLASLVLFEEAGMNRLREKSILLTSYLEILLKKKLGDKVKIITPSDVNQRGCQLSLYFYFNQSLINSAKRLEERLMEEGVVCDVRTPNIIRVAPAPLYNSFADVKAFVEILVEVGKEFDS